MYYLYMIFIYWISMVILMIIPRSIYFVVEIAVPSRSLMVKNHRNKPMELDKNVTAISTKRSVVTGTMEL